MAILTNGSLLTWGYNQYGQHGLGLTNSTSIVSYNARYPGRIVTYVAVGPTHAVVLYDGYISCFGILSDEPSVCSYHGNCISWNTCNCSTGYIGIDCSTFKCLGLGVVDPLVCSGHGTCIGYNICACNSGYSGTNCEKEIYGQVFGLGRNANYYQLGDDSQADSLKLTPTTGWLQNQLVKSVKESADFSIAISMFTKQLSYPI